MPDNVHPPQAPDETAPPTLVPVPIGWMLLPPAVLKHDRTVNVHYHRLAVEAFHEAVADLRDAGIEPRITEWDRSQRKPVEKVDVPVGPFYLSASWNDTLRDITLFSVDYDTRRGPLGDPA